MAWKEFNNDDHFDNAKVKAREAKAQLITTIVVAGFIGFVLGLLAGGAS